MRVVKGRLQLVEKEPATP
ncbi:hypothetical protein Gogos_011959 [Gossypium gossypioides]|uniref:Uncharacterized protein n=1 Tax=Gossypium gossypioides TaxID=34282 RepID=A0A7J9BR40_GOSGO|nr:hypothetical protein [Gossypium gossypioides]